MKFKDLIDSIPRISTEKLLEMVQSGIIDDEIALQWLKKVAAAKV